METTDKIRTRELVLDIMEDQLGIPRDSLFLDTTFNGLGIDSLDAVELVMELEEEFGICISDEDAEKIQTVGEAIKYIEIATQRHYHSGVRGNRGLTPLPDTIDTDRPIIAKGGTLLGTACEVRRQASALWNGPHPGGWMATEVERLRPGGGEDRKKGQVYIEWLKKHIDPIYLLKMAAELEDHAKGELRKVVAALGTKPLSKDQYGRRSNDSTK